MDKLSRYITRSWDHEKDRDQIPKAAKLLPPFFYEIVVYILITSFVIGGLQNIF